jgi:hypothetical protein
MYITIIVQVLQNKTTLVVREEGYTQSIFLNICPQLIFHNFYTYTILYIILFNEKTTTTTLSMCTCKTLFR